MRNTTDPSSIKLHRSAGRKYTPLIRTASLVCERKSLAVVYSFHWRSRAFEPAQKNSAVAETKTSSSYSLPPVLFWNTLEFVFGTEIATI
jgi:hypothetical protein